MGVCRLEQRPVAQFERSIALESMALVRSDDDPGSALRGVASKVVEHFPAACVEAAGGLIEEQQIGIERGCNRERDATHLAEAQLERRARREMARLETGPVERFFCPQ
ncbi:MAG TPA: hypothetical protein VLK83_05610, partial [Rhodanobacteraceae bacterium]|nr:hypothetical protein [Rhodanobacteraceae bacterium]